MIYEVFFKNHLIDFHLITLQMNTDIKYCLCLCVSIKSMTTEIYIFILKDEKLETIAFNTAALKFIKNKIQEQ